MKHAPGKLWPFFILTLALGDARAAGMGSDRSAYLELQAATAATHGALRALGPVLGDLVAAYHVALAQGQLPSARSDSLLHTRLRHRLRTLARRAQPGRAVLPLPPLPRVYHSRATSALRALSEAATLGDMLPPSRVLIDALLRLQAAERDLVLANAAALAPRAPEVDPVWSGPMDEAIVKLQRLVAMMAEAPRPLALDAQVELVETGGGTVEGAVLWAKPGASAGLRLSVCRITTAQTTAICHANIDPQLGHFEESLPQEAWAAPPSYRISAVSPFGVHSRPHDHVSHLTGGFVQGPTQVTAVPLAPAAESSEFYRLMDAVAVSWQLSLSDRSLADWDEGLQRLPPHRLGGYTIFRLTESQANAHGRAPSADARAKLLGPLRVGTVPPGVDHFIDRPPLAALARGLRYVVVAEADPSSAAARAAPQQMGMAQIDVGPAWQLAAHGALWAHQPLLWERQRTAELAQTPQELTAGIRAMQGRAEVTQRALWEGFWRSTPVGEREGWWQQNQQLYGDCGPTQLRRQAASGLTAEGLEAAQLALYIEAHADVAAAIEQHWALLDEAGKKRAQAHPLLPTPATADISPGMVASWPVRLAAWWHSRDVAQVAAVAVWWRDLPEAEQGAKLAAFVSSLPDDTLRPLVWPPWEALTPEEQQAWLSHPPRTVPQALWPRYLAHIDFEALPLGARVAAIRSDVGAWRCLLAQSRYILRPVDKLLNFNLSIALTFVGLGLLSGYLVGFAGGRPNNQGFD